MITITNFPMPPSINESYRCVTRKVLVKGKIKHVADFIGTDTLSAFKAEMERWSFLHRQDMDRLRTAVHEWVKDGFDLKVDLFCCWPRDRILTKTKKAKNKFHRLDVDNRLKAARDALSEIIKLDDTYFVTGLAEKVIQDEGKEPCSIVQISKTRIRFATEILNPKTAAL